MKFRFLVLVIVSGLVVAPALAGPIGVSFTTGNPFPGGTDPLGLFPDTPITGTFTVDLTGLAPGSLVPLSAPTVPFMLTCCPELEVFLAPLTVISVKVSFDAAEVVTAFDILFDNLVPPGQTEIFASISLRTGPGSNSRVTYSLVEYLNSVPPFVTVGGAQGEFEYFGGTTVFTPTAPTVVPEPSTVFLLGTGLLGLVGYTRRKTE